MSKKKWIFFYCMMCILFISTCIDASNKKKQPNPFYFIYFKNNNLIRDNKKLDFIIKKDKLGSRFILSENKIYKVGDQFLKGIITEIKFDYFVVQVASGEKKRIYMQ